jgi:hypothetical protein
MKEIVYTCEHCGSEYTITEPGQYQCPKCNNVFTVAEVKAPNPIKIHPSNIQQFPRCQRPIMYQQTGNDNFPALKIIGCIFFAFLMIAGAISCHSNAVNCFLYQ